MLRWYVFNIVADSRSSYQVVIWTTTRHGIYMGNVFSILCFCGGHEIQRPESHESDLEMYEHMDDAVEFYFSHPIYLQDEIEYIEDGMLSCEKNRRDVQSA